MFYSLHFLPDTLAPNFCGRSGVRIFTCNGPSITTQTQPASSVRRRWLNSQLVVGGWCGRDFTSARNFTFKAPRLGYRWARSPSLQHDVLTVAERIRLREDHDESFPRVFGSSDRSAPSRSSSYCISSIFCHLCYLVGNVVNMSSYTYIYNSQLVGRSHASVRAQLS